MSLIETMQERRDAMKADLDSLLNTASTEKRELTGDEDTKFDTLIADIKRADERITELRAAATREASAAETRKQAGEPVEQRAVGGAQVTDPEVYAKGNHRRSYLRDLAKSQVFGDRDAAERIERHARAMADDNEKRALGNTNTTGGSGGEFAPPTWLVNDYVSLARMGRVTADLYQHSDVPVGTSSINIPKVLTGTAVGLQSTQNTTLINTDLTTGSVGTGFSTIGGRQIVSQQLLDQTDLDFDRVITADMAAAYAQNLGSQVIYGTGTGANNNAVVNGLVNAAIATALNVTYTSGTPTAAGLYSKAAGLISAFVTNRLAQPSNWLMHPRRYYWLLAQVDANNRPLVVPESVAFNPIATTGEPVQVAGRTGMTFLGLPVYIDPQLPTNLGAGTNQDEIFLMKADDLWLFESPTRAEVFREPYAESLGVLFRLYAYTGTILNRYSANGGSIGTINGTGLVAPTF